MQGLTGPPAQDGLRRQLDAVHISYDILVMADWLWPMQGLTGPPAQDELRQQSDAVAVILMAYVVIGCIVMATMAYVNNQMMCESALYSNGLYKYS